MKVYKRYKAALIAANGTPILRVHGFGKARGTLYIVGAGHEFTSLDLINGFGQLKGSISMMHLERLGNANHAKPGEVAPFSGRPCFACRACGGDATVTDGGPCPVCRTSDRRKWETDQRASA